MKADKVETFMELAGQEVAHRFDHRSPEIRKLGAQLLLSEVLEYVIKGLGVVPVVNGVKITEPEGLTYEATNQIHQKEALDGLCDVAYTMYWNALAFGLPLEGAFDAVCDNNLEKFVALENWNSGEGELAKSKWDCQKNITWPAEVTQVSVIKVKDTYYAVGKDKNGKVRKPSCYKSIELDSFLA